MILGVCEELEQRTELDAWVFRIIFIILASGCFGTGFIAYLIAYFVLN